MNRFVKKTVDPKLASRGTIRPARYFVRRAHDVINNCRISGSAIVSFSFAFVLAAVKTFAGLGTNSIARKGKITTDVIQSRNFAACRLDSPAVAVTGPLTGQGKRGIVCTFVTRQQAGEDC